MKDGDVSKQIQQMVRFIRQEAEEKVNEISVSAEEEFNIEKLKLLELEKKKVRQEFDRKSKQVEVRNKIEYSMKLNAARIQVLQEQDNLVTALKDSVSKAPHHVSDDKDAYKKLLKSLIAQSLLLLKEQSVLLRCREIDATLVQSVLDEAKKEYADKAKMSPPKITVDKHVYLPPPPSGTESHGPSCLGGIVLASQDGKIVCENTLNMRMDVGLRKKLPEIRKMLFVKAN